MVSRILPINRSYHFSLPCYFLWPFSGPWTLRYDVFSATKWWMIATFPQVSTISEKKTFGKLGNGRQLGFQCREAVFFWGFKKNHRVNTFTSDLWRSLLNVIFDATKIEIDN